MPDTKPLRQRWRRWLQRPVHVADFNTPLLASLEVLRVVMEQAPGTAQPKSTVTN